MITLELIIKNHITLGNMMSILALHLFTGDKISIGADDTYERNAADTACTSTSENQTIPKNAKGKPPLAKYLSRRVQHIFNKYAITPCRVIHQNMSYRAN